MFALPWLEHGAVRKKTTFLKASSGLFLLIQINLFNTIWIWMFLKDKTSNHKHKVSFMLAIGAFRAWGYLNAMFGLKLKKKRFVKAFAGSSVIYCLSKQIPKHSISIGPNWPKASWLGCFYWMQCAVDIIGMDKQWPDPEWSKFINVVMTKEMGYWIH